MVLKGSAAGKAWFSIRPLVFFYFLASFFFSEAQVPGYVGKRFVTGYGFNCSPAFIGSTPSGNKLNVIHDFYLDYVIGTEWTMGPAIRYYRTIYDNRRILTDLDVQPESYYNISGITLCLNFKHYRYNYLAPWGKYFMISPVVNIARTKHDAYMHVKGRISGHDTLFTEFGETVQTFYHPDLMIGWGKSRIVGDRFSIDYGLNFQVFAMMTVLSESGYYWGPPLIQENYISETHRNRVNQVNRFNVFLKLGYLF